MNDNKRAGLLDLAANLGFTHKGGDAYEVTEASLLNVMDSVAAIRQSLEVSELSKYEQEALIVLGLKPPILPQDSYRVVLCQGVKQVDLYTTHPELLVRMVDGELHLLQLGDAHRIETVDYTSLQALSVKLYEYQRRHFYEHQACGNDTRAAEAFIDWVRNGVNPPYTTGTTWENFVRAVRSCAYNNGLRRMYGVHTITLSKIPNTNKLYIEVDHAHIKRNARSA